MSLACGVDGGSISMGVPTPKEHGVGIRLYRARPITSEALNRDCVACVFCTLVSTIATSSSGV